MVATFATSIEWFHAGVGLTQTPTATTRPSVEAIDLNREMLYYQLIEAAGTSTDKNNILRMMELKVGTRWVKGVLKGQLLECQMTPEEFQYVVMKFNNLETAPYQPNQNG